MQIPRVYNLSMDTKRRWWLYVLKLEHGKWYVGITSQEPQVRFLEHKAGRRAAYWTMAHKPLEIELTEDLGVVTRQHAEVHENKITRSLMKERGLNNVRGGDLTNIDDYIKRFGWIYLKDGWQLITLIVFLLLVILVLLIDKFFLY